MPKFLFVMMIYFVLNLAYSLGLKNISILDVMLLSLGFVLRVKAGGVIANIAISQWLMIMIFLLAIFMAVAKRRDDVLIKLKSGGDMRKSIKGYNLEFFKRSTFPARGNYYCCLYYVHHFARSNGALENLPHVLLKPFCNCRFASLSANYFCRKQYRLAHRSFV